MYILITGFVQTLSYKYTNTKYIENLGENLDMKQIEVTVKVNENIDEAFKKIKNLGFKIIRESYITDIYMTSKLQELNKDNIQYILKNSVLLRILKLANKELKKITYKNKEYDINRKCYFRAKNKCRHSRYRKGKKNI